MENQDKIFDKLKDAAQKAESKGFPAMEKVWGRVEEKLDKKEDKKVIALWKKLAVAASLLLFLSLGYQFFMADNTTNPNPENSVVVTRPESPAKTENAVVEAQKKNPVIRKDAVKILERQLSKTTNVAVNDTVSRRHFMQSKDRKSAYFVSPGAAVSASKQDEPETEALAIREESQKEAPADKLFKAESVAPHYDSQAKTAFAASVPTEKQTITGVVTDGQGPLPGATVAIKGSTRGVQTDFDGKYIIDVEKGEQIIFSFIGMNDAVAVVGNENIMNMALNENSAQLSEVVISGYAKRVKKPATISPDEMFRNDLQTNNLRIYLVGGFVPAAKPDDADFEKKYGIKYHDFGCVIPENANVYMKYNRLVFKHLDRKFGQDWKNEANSAALGWRAAKKK